MSTQQTFFSIDDFVQSTGPTMPNQVSFKSSVNYLFRLKLSDIKVMNYVALRKIGCGALGRPPGACRRPGPVVRPTKYRKWINQIE